MTFTTSTPKKSRIALAVASAALAWGMEANATDFSIFENEFLICNTDLCDSASTVGTATVGADGVISPITGVADSSAFGMATFQFGLITSHNPTPGSYTFEVHVVIRQDNAQRKIEAKIPSLRLEVATDNSVTGNIDAGQVLTFWGETPNIRVEGDLLNQAGNFEVLSDGSVVFRAGMVLERLADRHASFDTILNSFDREGHYSYAIFVKQTGGPGGEEARFGTLDTSSAFAPLPCATTSEIDGWFGPEYSSATGSYVTPPQEGAYAVQGQFSTDGAAGSPGPAPTAFTGCAVAADTTAPAAPSLSLLVGSDSGPSDTDGKTKHTTPAFRVTLNGSTTDGTAPVEGDTAKIFSGTSTLVAYHVLTATDIANDYVDITLPSLANGIFSYEAKIMDAAGNFSAGSSVVGITVDTAAPVISNGSVNGSTLTLSYTETGSGLASAIPPASAFTLTKNGGESVSVTGVTVNVASKSVVLTLGSAVSSTDSNILLSYVPGTSRIQDLAGNEAASLTALSVINATPSSGGGGTVTPPPTETVDEGLDEIGDIVETITIPATEIDSATLNSVQNAATVATSLASQAAASIAAGTLTPAKALDVLGTIGNVINLTGQATSASAGTGASDTASKGVSTLKGFADVIGSLTTSLKGSSTDGSAKTALTSVQKDAVQQAAVKSVVSGVKVLAGAASAEEKKSVLQSLGQILSSTLSLGVSVTQEQSQAVLDAADQNAAGDDNSDPDSSLDNNAVTFRPAPDLPSRAELVSTLAGSGVDEDEAEHILAQLAQAINPSDVNIGGTSAADTLLSGLLASLSGTPGAADLDPQSLTYTVTVGGNAGGGSGGQQLAKVSAAPRSIPARAVSVSVVSSTFPEGLRVRANGSVVITDDRIATVMVPSSYDPLNFFADLSGTVTTDEDGGIDIVKNAFPFGYHFSGTFDYRGITEGGPAAERTTLVNPAAGVNEADLNFVYTVQYRDGTTQSIQPYISDNDFVSSVRSRGISVITNRNTGVVTVNGRHFRPSYFVEPLTADAQAFLQAHGDDFGIAYRPMDVNGDGVTDYEIISETGIQVAYGLTL